MTTKYPAIASTSVTTAIQWVVPNLGMVRTEFTDTTTVYGFSFPSTSQVVATSVQ